MFWSQHTFEWNAHIADNEKRQVIFNTRIVGQNVAGKLYAKVFFATRATNNTTQKVKKN